MGLKLNLQKQFENKAGPGAYEVTDSYGNVTKTGPKYSMSSKYSARTYGKSPTPGPADYDQSHDLK